MWKSLSHGEHVSVGDTVRYRSKSNTQQETGEKLVVVKIEQHYFEVIEDADRSYVFEAPRRKIVRYFDIGYNVLLDRWTD